MVSLLRRAILLLAGALTLALVAPTFAQAALTHTVSVTIDQINCGTACDGQGIEGPFDGEPDWYAKVFMNGGVAERQDAAGQHGEDHARVGCSRGPSRRRRRRSTYGSRSGIATPTTTTWPTRHRSSTTRTSTSRSTRVKNRVSGEIGGAVGDQLCTFGNGEDGDGSAIVCLTAGTGDRDGDGLQDSWETDGIDFDGDGMIDLALDAPPFNADPDHKDLFMEVDHMACSVGGCAAGGRPQPRAAAGSAGRRRRGLRGRTGRESGRRAGHHAARDAGRGRGGAQPGAVPDERPGRKRRLQRHQERRLGRHVQPATSRSARSPSAGARIARPSCRPSARSSSTCSSATPTRRHQGPRASPSSTRTAATT